MGSLSYDIKKANKWLIKKMHKQGHVFNHTLESIKIMEEIFDENIANGEPIIGGFFENHYGWKVFAMSAYLGETIIHQSKAVKWNVDDIAPDGELTIELESANGARMWPAQRIINRIREGNENNLHHYASHAIERMAYDGEIPTEYIKRISPPRKWWQFW